MKYTIQLLLITLGLISLTFPEMGMSSEIELWGTSVSPYVRKVQNVLDYKALQYKQHEILPRSLLLANQQEVPVKFEQASPLGKIPALTHENVEIADSAVIVAYLEKVRPLRSVYPKNPVEFSRALWIEKYSDTTATEVIHPIFFERVVKPAELNQRPNELEVNRLTKEELPKILTYLNFWLRSHSTTYFAGSEISVADFAVVQQLIDLDVSHVKWKNGEYPTLEQYYNRMVKHPVIVKSIPKNFQIESI